MKLHVFLFIDGLHVQKCEFYFKFHLNYGGLAQNTEVMVDWADQSFFPAMYIWVDLNIPVQQVLVFNSIALRMAKTPLRFCHSECNRVK